MPRTPKPIAPAANGAHGHYLRDDGLDAIDTWMRWFVGAHTQRLADRHLPADQYARALEDVRRAAAAIHERMRSDYLVRRRP
jgi:hypothetical protein